MQNEGRQKKDKEGRKKENEGDEAKRRTSLRAPPTRTSALQMRQQKLANMATQLHIPLAREPEFGR